MSKVNRLDLVVWSLVIMVLVAILGLILWGPISQVRILGIEPKSEATISSTSYISIYFDMPMDHASVETHFRIQPEVIGHFEWQEKTLFFYPASLLAPGTTYTVELQAGAESLNGQKLLRAKTWQFHTWPRTIVYIASISGAREIHRLIIPDGTKTTLTATGGRVFEFSVAPDSSALVFSVINEQGGVDLWTVDLASQDQKRLLDCGSDHCRLPDWSPDGTRIAYTRQERLAFLGNQLGPPRVWLLELSSHSTAPLYAEKQVIGTNPAWSPDGSQLAFYDGEQNQIRIYAFEGSYEILLPSYNGRVGTWSPDSRHMVYSDVYQDADRLISAIYLADLATGEVSFLLDEGQTGVTYGPPDWSPNGEWLLLSAILNQQRVLLRIPISGTYTETLTDEPVYAYTQYSWDPWSQGAVFRRDRLQSSEQQSEIVFWDRQTATYTPLITDAAFPRWLP